MYYMYECIVIDEAYGNWTVVPIIPKVTMCKIELANNTMCAILIFINNEISLSTALV